MNFSIPDEKEIRKAFAEGEEAVVALFGGVTAQVEELAVQPEKQAEMLKDLQARLSKNSRNSGKPPSGDGYGKKNRTESLRKSGRKPNGGQPGRKGHTLKKEAVERRYDEIVRRGFADNPFTPPKEKKTPPLNLPTRLRDYKAEPLAFMYDFRVPFDNSAAERDARMMKVRRKVSGCFRTFEGAERFAGIRGYISAARKNSKNIFEAIGDAFLGNPFIPDAAA